MKLVHLLINASDFDIIRSMTSTLHIVILLSKIEIKSKHIDIWEKKKLTKRRMFSLHQIPVIQSKKTGTGRDLKTPKTRKHKANSENSSDMSEDIKLLLLSSSLEESQPVSGGDDNESMSSISISSISNSMISASLPPGNPSLEEDDSMSESDSFIDKVLPFDDPQSRQEKERSTLWLELMSQWIDVLNVTGDTDEKETNKSEKKSEEEKDKTLKQLHQCAKSLVNRNPIPNDVRSHVWFVLSGAMSNMRSYPKDYYRDLYTKPCDSQVEHNIKKDIYRTFGGQGYNYVYERHGSTTSNPSTETKDTMFGESLKRILVAYANFDTGLGYCQGMNYIAAFLLQGQYKLISHTYACV
ncbi:hypothetical protein RFI_02587, partial [Reticulomyxa filosa]